MSYSSSLWRIVGDPSAIGFAAAIGERCEDTSTGLVYVKSSDPDTGWILGTSAYGGGGGGGGASTADAFITIGHPADLTGERALTGSATISVTDGGANGAATLGVIDGSVSNAKLAQVPANTIKGNNTGSPASPSDLTSAQVSAMIGPVGVILVDFTKDLGTANSSGKFDLTGLSGLTVGKNIVVVQTSQQIASKGNARDEFEMDNISLTGYVVDAATIRVYWHAPSVVVGTYAFAYQVSA